ncbi:GRAM domain-containing protein 2A-like [Mastacembelus armatus]|uniref:GRAM domain-containing protein 2A-like n=1 Tax=Mastacembelus armatus TaxID=205130 RepID=UPI000E45DBA9|nr:GRAM domain-containing protein 2A-like [Mastacembelus armatus]
MCMSWKCLFSIMSFKARKISLDSTFSVDGVGVRRGTGWFGSKKSKHSSSLDNGRLEIQELNQRLNSNMSFREQIISEDSLERSDEVFSNHNLQKHSKTFHKLFQDIPEGENLTQTFICALQKEVLYHGKLFVSEHHVCFYSSVLLKDTKVVIPAASVRKVKKHNTALSMLSIQTADREKYTFVSLRNREMCYKLLQSVCSHAQQGDSPHLSSAENEADVEAVLNYSSLEDSVDHCLSTQNSINLDDSFLPISSDGPMTFSASRQSSFIDEDSRAVSWFWRLFDMVARFFIFREFSSLSILFNIYMVL